MAGIRSGQSKDTLNRREIPDQAEKFVQLVAVSPMVGAIDFGFARASPDAGPAR